MLRVQRERMSGRLRLFITMLANDVVAKEPLPPGKAIVPFWGGRQVHLQRRLQYCSQPPFRIKAGRAHRRSTFDQFEATAMPPIQCMP